MATSVYVLNFKRGSIIVSICGGWKRYIHTLVGIERNRWCTGQTNYRTLRASICNKSSVLCLNVKGKELQTEAKLLLINCELACNEDCRIKIRRCFWGKRVKLTKSISRNRWCGSATGYKAWSRGMSWTMGITCGWQWYQLCTGVSSFVWGDVAS